MRFAPRIDLIFCLGMLWWPLAPLTAQTSAQISAAVASAAVSPAAVSSAAVAPQVAPQVAPASPTVRYGRDIRPLLADRCFRCHGPDPAQRQAELRLDERDQAIAVHKNGAAIVPGSPEQSLLWQRVRAHDDKRMPPQKSGKVPLDDRDLDLIERWIRQGAPYEAHWAFVPPVRPEVPTIGSGKNPIDHFLAAGRADHGLEASPPADRQTLARRLFLVLTGLPPTTAELEAFRADCEGDGDGDSDAWQRLVDRLFDTEPYRTRHAEHLARIWLDAGRYADTSGIHMDAGRQAWQWRDWLIDALRDDLPFDQFVVDQLAGDLLPDATPQQRVATGFLRNHVTTDEGGAIDQEYRVEYAAERTATVGSVFLGLTVGCARCHDHKYDPIRQEDYYRLFSFFDSNQEPGLYSQSPDANRALEPFLEVPTQEQQHQRQQLQAQRTEAQRQRDEVSPAERAAYDGFLTETRQLAATSWTLPHVTAATSKHGATMTVEADGAVFVSGDNPARDEHVLTLASEGPAQRCLLLEALPDARLGSGKVGRTDNGNVVLQFVELEARASGAEPWHRVPLVDAVANVEQEDGDFVARNVLENDNRGWAVAAHQHGPQPARLLLLAGEAFGGGGSELRLTLHYDSQYAQHIFGRVRVETTTLADAMLAHLPLATGTFYVAGPFEAGGNDALYATQFGPEAALSIDPQQVWGKTTWRADPALREGIVNTSLPSGANATYVAQRLFAPTARTVQLAFGSDDGFQLYLNGKQVAEHRIDRGAALDQETATLTLPQGNSLLVLKVVNTGGIGGFAIRYVPPADELTAALALSLLPAEVPDPATDERLRSTYRDLHSPVHKQHVAEVMRLEQALTDLDAMVPRAMVMQEAAMPTETYVLTRGDYDKPDKSRPVTRELPQMFGSLPPDAPHNRLGLARWIVSADDPLFDRVAVNRLWEFVFGTGLVRTSEDFGYQGEWPSNPELLDWLATEFRAHGHSVRHILRLMVTSDAFRQQSRVTAAAEVDRDDRQLCWFPRRRLGAEALRDQALSIAGLLVERVGGPSVKPYQPPGLWQEVAMVQSNTRLFVQGSGDDLWRRSIYTYWKRACPPPNLLLLDAPTREFCTIRRTTTNTPLQALAMWNDEQFVEAARVLAEHMLSEQPDDTARLVEMYRRCTARELAGDDLQQSLATLQTLQRRYRDDPAAAAALVHHGERAPLAPLPAEQLAPLVLLANAFLNLDATLCID